VQLRVNTKTRKVSEYEDGAHREKDSGGKIKWGGKSGAVHSQYEDLVGS